MYRSLETQLDLEKQCIAAQNLGKYFHEKGIRFHELAGDTFYARMMQECSSREYRDARYIMGMDE